jgi:CheY-like chemotaxis protein
VVPSGHRYCGGGAGAPPGRRDAVARVLIAVKDAKERSSLASAYRVTGNTVVEAADAASCLEVLEKAPPDAMVLDPRLSGLESSQLLRHVRRNTGLATMKVSLLAHGMTPDLWEFLGRQFFDLVVEEEGAQAAGRLASGAGKARPARTKTKTLSRGGSGDVKRILVVEDEPAYCILLGTEFQSLGWETEGADSAEAALEFMAAKGGRVDAVLSDINLPGMDGCALAHRIKVGHPEMKVVLMTGMPKERYPTPPKGVPILPKPISVRLLMAAMKFL